jgi:DNA modification methylase
LDEIQVLLDNEILTDQDPVPDVDPCGAAVSRHGDMWRLGEHLLLCGDALSTEPYERLLAGEKAQLVIADAPYNVRINGNVTSKSLHREFLMASGEMSSKDYTDFLTRAFANLITFSEDGSIHFLFIDWRHLAELLAAGEQFTELKNLICWNKQTAGMGSFYRSQHELIFAFKNGSKPHINNFGLGEKGRHRSNIWDYPGLSGWGRARDSELAMHPTVKPLAMIADAIKDCSKKNGIVLDCFGGSGTTLIAAERTGRRARLIELDPLYVDVIIRRFEAATGRKALLDHCGRSFESVASDGR